MDLLQYVNDWLLFVKFSFDFSKKRLLLELELADVCALNFAVLFVRFCSPVTLNSAATKLDLLFVPFSELEQCLYPRVASHLLLLRPCKEAWPALVDCPAHACSYPHKFRLLWEFTEGIVGADRDVT